MFDFAARTIHTSGSDNIIINESIIVYGFILGAPSGTAVWNITNADGSENYFTLATFTAFEASEFVVNTPFIADSGIRIAGATTSTQTLFYSNAGG
jgi:hypothetical protein